MSEMLMGLAALAAIVITNSTPNGMPHLLEIPQSPERQIVLSSDDDMEEETRLHMKKRGKNPEEDCIIINGPVQHENSLTELDAPRHGKCLSMTYCKPKVNFTGNSYLERNFMKSFSIRTEEYSEISSYLFVLLVVAVCCSRVVALGFSAGFSVVTSCQFDRFY